MSRVIQTHKTHTASQRRILIHNHTLSEQKSDRWNLLTRKTWWWCMPRQHVGGQRQVHKEQTRSRWNVNQQATLDTNTKHDHHDHSKYLTTTNANVAQQQFSRQPARNTSEHEPSTTPDYQSCRKHRFRAASPSKALSWSFGNQGILFESSSNNSTRFYTK